MAGRQSYVDDAKWLIKHDGEVGADALERACAELADDDGLIDADDVHAWAERLRLGLRP